MSLLNQAIFAFAVILISEICVYVFYDPHETLTYIFLVSLREMIETIERDLFD